MTKTKIKKLLMMLLVPFAIFSVGMLLAANFNSVNNVINTVQADDDESDDEKDESDDEKDDEKDDEDDEKDEKDDDKKDEKKKQDEDDEEDDNDEDGEDEDGEDEDGEDEGDEDEGDQNKTLKEIDEAQEEINKAASHISNRKAQGLVMTGASEKLSQARSLLSQARTAYRQALYGKAKDLADDAKELTEKARHMFNGRNNFDDDEEDEEESEDEIVSREIIKNDDGTIMEKITKIAGNETEIKEVTYDVNGNKIMEKKMELGHGDENEVKIKTFDIFGNELSKYELKTKDGKVVKIEMKDSELGKSKVKYDAKNGVLIIKTSGTSGSDSSNHLKIRVNGDQFTITQSGHQVTSAFPMTVDEGTGQILVQTSAGNVELKAMPDTIVQSVQGKKQLDVVEGVELADSKGLKYVVSGTKFEKFLGLFTVEIPATLTYDAQTGNYVRSDVPFFSKVLSLFSF